MNKSKKICSLLLTGILLTGCQGNKAAVGGVTGALIGGLAGSAFGKGEGRLVATGLGAVAGAFIGSSIGHQLDERDKLLMEKTAQRAFEYTPSGQKSEWVNPDTGHSGYIEPTKVVQRSQGQYCREFTQVVKIGGESKKAYGVACRKPDGAWEIVQ